MPVIKNDPMVGNRIPFGDLLPNKAKLNISGDSIDQEVNFTAKQVAIITKDGNVPVGIKKLAVYGKRAGTDVEYVDDNTASKGKALRLVSGKQVRSTKKVAYDQEDTYLVQIRAKEIVSGTIVAGVIGYDGEDPINRNMFPLIKDFVKCTIAESDNPIGSGYVTFNGYISGVGSSFIEPAHATGSPSVIPTGSTSFGVMVKAESGEFYIDSIHVDKVVDITGTSGGQEIIDTVEGIEGTLSETDAKFGIFVNVDTFGLNPSDGSVYLYGIQNDGTKIDGDGRIEVANVQAVVPNGAVTTIDNTRNLLLLVGSSVIAARYNPNTAKIENVSGVEQTSGVIIGEVSNNSGGCSSALAYAIAKDLDDGKADELQRTFSYLTEPGVDQAEFEARSQAMGIDTFFNFFVAYEAIIRKLYVGNITAGNGTGAPSSGMRFRVHTYDEITGELLDPPIWDVYYGDKVIFKIDSSTGDISFGDTDNGGGLKWENSTSTLRSKDSKLVIKTDGTIQATDGVFSGTIEAQENLSIRPNAEWIMEPVTAGTASILSEKDATAVSTNNSPLTISTSFLSIMNGTINVYNILSIRVSGESTDWGGHVEIEVNGINVFTSDYVYSHSWETQSETTTITIESGDSIVVKNVKTKLDTFGTIDTTTKIRINEPLGSITNNIISLI